MEPLYRSIVERAKKHPTFWDFLREHFTGKYLEAHRELFGEDEHYKRVLNARNGIFDMDPKLFMKLHEELGHIVGIPSEPERRDSKLRDLYVVRVNPKYSSELAEEMARAAAAAEKLYGKPIWEIPRADAIAILKNTALGVHKRYRDREPVLIGPANIV